MSSNLIGGFFQRLEACRKYAFGTLVVFGEDNKNEIHGYFIIRGQEIPEILKDVPDYESYNFTKVDPTDAQVKKNWEDYIAWDGDLEGMKFADGGLLLLLRGGEFGVIAYAHMFFSPLTGKIFK